MTTKDIYKEFKLRGYQYANLFRGLESSSTTGNRGYIAWMNNWVTFMDNMLQMKMLSCDTRSLYVPIEIQKLVIDTELHAQYIQNITVEEKRKFTEHRCPLIKERDYLFLLNFSIYSMF